MRSNYIFNDIDKLIEVLQQMKEKHPDRAIVTGVIGGGSVHAPTKQKKDYRHKLEMLFSPDCFANGENGVSALMSGGGIYIAHVPKEFINPEFLKEKEQ
jgi:hypothetical protein